MDGKLKLLLADKFSLMRNGLTDLVNNSPFYEVLDTASTGIELIEKYFLLKPDLLLSNITLPETTGIQAAYKIRERDTEVKAILYTENFSEEYIFYSIKAGAKALIKLTDDTQELFYAIMQVCQGNTYFGKKWNNEELGKIISKFENHHCPAVYKGINLTNTELEVLYNLYRGLTARQIAINYYKSKKTVDNQIYQIKKKLNAKNMVELYKYFQLLYPALSEESLSDIKLTY